VPVVQWQRRPTEAEFAGILGAEQARRSRAVALAGRDQPPPTFGPLPIADTTTVAVFACAEHTIHVDQAAQVHAAACSAPCPDHLPLCDCEPEPLPAPEPRGGPMTVLPTGWTVPAPPTI
jgi:hypothetical protein